MRLLHSDLPLDGGVATLTCSVFFTIAGGTQLTGAGGWLAPFCPLGEPEPPESGSTGVPDLLNHRSTAAYCSGGLSAFIRAITRCVHSLWQRGLRDDSRIVCASVSAHIVGISERARSQTSADNHCEGSSLPFYSSECRYSFGLLFARLAAPPDSQLPRYNVDAIPFAPNDDSRCNRNTHIADSFSGRKKGKGCDPGNGLTGAHEPRRIRT
jgi:hypothetical protein